MMESNFYSDEFEQLIRGKTEQYKMYPSEKVWKGIHGSLHTKRRWYIMGMSLLILGILFFAGKELIAPAAHPSLARKTNSGQSPVTDSFKTNSDNTHSPVAAGTRFHAKGVVPDADRVEGEDEEIGGEAGQEQSRAFRGLTITVANPVISQPDLSEFLSHMVKLPAETPALPVNDSRLAGSNEDHNLTGAAGGVASNGVGTAGNAEGAGLSGSGMQEDGSTGTERAGARSARTAHSSNVSTKNLATTRGESGAINDHEAKVDSASQASNGSVKFTEAIGDQQRVNWLADYAFYNLTPSEKKGRTQFQLYFSPTISYRSLSGGGLSSKSTYQNIPVSLIHIGQAKDYVDHNPSLGFAIGGMMEYRLTRNLTVKGGLQFSFSRYTIKAYISNTPQQATIALNSYYGYYVDSITTTTYIGNFAGSHQISLNNDYYQLSAPVGFELRVMGNERLQLNVGATIQPTYLLNTNSYMLTTDYTSYVKEPSLMRRWNLNGGLEAFLSYKMRSGLRWQVGPEFRYQLMSTYDAQYPLHEHLKGYGIKFGIVKTLP